MTNAPSLSTRRKLAFAFVAVCLPLLLLEGGLRVGKTLVEDLSPSNEWYVYDSVVGWRPRPGYRGTIIHGYRQFDQHGYLACDRPQIDDPQAERVVVVGDSTAMGYGVSIEQTFAEQLDRRLPDRAVINLGVNGYSSLQTAIRLEEALEELHPTTVIVACGFNDRRYVLDSGQTDSEAHYRQIGSLSPHWYESSYLFRGMRKLFAPPPAPPQATSIEALPPRVGPEAFRENLLRMARGAQAHNARLLFLVLHDNPTKTADLHAGIALLGEGDAEGARQLFQRSVQAGNMFSDLARLELARLDRTQGQSETAEKTLEVRSPIASLHGGRPTLLDREYAEIIRGVAKETGTEAIEAGAALDQSPGVYFDFCHFDEIGNRIVAELLREQLSSR